LWKTVWKFLKNSVYCGSLCEGRGERGNGKEKRRDGRGGEFSPPFYLLSSVFLELSNCIVISDGKEASKV
jgi:hypothetical protein